MNRENERDHRCPERDGLTPSEQEAGETLDTDSSQPKDADPDPERNPANPGSPACGYPNNPGRTQ